LPPEEGLAFQGEAFRFQPSAEVEGLEMWTGTRGCFRRMPLAVGAILVLLLGCQAEKKEERIIIKVGHVLAPTEPTHQAALKWAERVKERTNGRVELQVFPSSQLGSNRDTYEQARLGANVIGHTDPGYMSEFVPDFGVLNGPFLFDDWNTEGRKLVNSPLMAELKERLRREAGLRVLAFNWYFGPRHLISDRPIRNPEEMKGLKVRVPPNPMWQETIAAMGGTPTTLEWAEVYTGLGQGVVDAAEAPLSTLVGSRLYEVKKVITLTGHFNAVTGMVIGERFFQGLPPDVQKILEEEAIAAGEVMSQMTLALQEEYRKKLEQEGVTFVQGDVQAFRKATEVVYSRFPKWTPGLYARVKEIREKGAL